jgi:hypothetical protein
MRVVEPTYSKPSVTPTKTTTTPTYTPTPTPQTTMDSVAQRRNKRTMSGVRAQGQPTGPIGNPDFMSQSIGERYNQSVWPGVGQAIGSAYSKWASSPKPTYEQVQAGWTPSKGGAGHISYAGVAGAANAGAGGGGAPQGAPPTTPGLSSYVPPAGASTNVLPGGTNMPGAMPGNGFTNQTPIGQTQVNPAVPGAVTDPAQLQSIVYSMAEAQANGIRLAPEELTQYTEAIMALTGLDQAITVIDPKTNMRVTAQLDPGELALDENGVQRGVRINMVSSVLGQGVRSPEELTSIAAQQVGGIGMTVDEVQMMFPNVKAADRGLGYDWRNDSNAIANDGSQGNVMMSPNGTSQAPVFSGFYLAQDGMYYPLNTAALAPQYDEYSAQEGGGNSGPSRPVNPKPKVVGQNTANANASSVAMLNQPLY